MQIRNLAAALLLAVGCTQMVSTPEEYVSTLVGTLSDFSLSTGNTYPATAVPWGMNFWTPQTGRNGDGWQYGYQAKEIRGFKQTHQPSPWINDHACFSIMPVRDAALMDQDARASVFSHESETALPYYYQVYLADSDVNVEIAPTERAAVMRFTFPESATSGIVVEAFDGSVQVDGNRVVGYSKYNHGGVTENFCNYFVVEFDCPVEAGEVVSVDGDPSLCTTVVKFATKRGDVVCARAASSYISAEQALLNLKEASGSFEDVKASAKSAWNKALGRISVGGGTEDQYRTFYSCLYRCLLFPMKIYEIDNQGNMVHYSPYDGQIHAGEMYGGTGFWDTFRALFPLLNLAYPEQSAEIMRGFANIARENEFIPEWSSPGHRDCMIGNNSASVVADAALRGLISDEDLQVLYDALVYGTEHVHPQVSASGRKGYEYYNSLGYVPYDVGINENVARTLEYAYDDWCIAKIAEKLGRPQSEIDLYMSRSGNWRNVFDPSVNLMRGRNQDGSFQEPFSPYKWGDAFTEGNAWHYTWSVFHDVPGLIEAMGGRSNFIQMLDSVFVVPPIYDDSYYGFRIHEITEMQVANMGNYAHGNQPAQHMIYLYDLAGEHEKCVHWVRETMSRLYSATPDGYCGDEDNGQTSAWYVFSALGYYPVCPASGEYAYGEPLFKKVKITK